MANAPRSLTQRPRWWRVVIEWQLGTGPYATRYSYVTKCVEESVAIFAAINCLIVDTSHTLGAGDSIRVLSCDPHAYQRKHDELVEIP